MSPNATATGNQQIRAIASDNKHTATSSNKYAIASGNKRTALVTAEHA